MRVTQLWRFPVKSMGGEKVTRCRITSIGLDGDRRWAVLDRSSGHVLTAKRDGRLLMASARCAGEGGVVVTLPNGVETDETGPIADWLDLDVELVTAGTEGGIYDNPRDFEREQDWVTWQGPPGAFHDMRRARVSLISEGSAREWDVRRFRSNVVVGGEGEDALVGSTVTVGSAFLDVVKQIDRCVMVTRAQPGIVRDVDILRTINREQHGFLAVGALVARAGVVAVGDQVRVVDAA